MTAVTSQNTTGVADIFALSPQVVRSQIDQIAEDVEICRRQDRHARDRRDRARGGRRRRTTPEPNLVVDPVSRSTGQARQPAARAGAPCSTPEAVSILKTRLLPLATVVTPNVAEAAALSGIQVDSLSTRTGGGKADCRLGPAAVVIKGGHLGGPQAIDVLFHEGVSPSLRRPAPLSATSTARDARSRRLSPRGWRLATTFRPRFSARSATSQGRSQHSFEIGHGARMLESLLESAAYTSRCRAHDRGHGASRRRRFIIVGLRDER